MKNQIRKLFIALAVLVLSIINSQLSTAFAQGATAFTYQGQLRDNGSNANGAYTMIFALYDSVSGGNLIGGPITSSPTLANGLFTVNLDFGSSAFNGSARYLDITITNGGATQELSPRVQVLPTPYALFAEVAATVTNGAITSAQLAAGAVASTNIQNGAITTALLATNAVATTNIQNGAITDSKIAAFTSLLSSYGVETNLRVVRGIMGNHPSPSTPVVGTNSASYTNFGSGYTVTNYPPGSGGTLVGYFSVTIDGNGDYLFSLVNGSINNPGIAPYGWIEANGGGDVSPDAEILQVQSVFVTTNDVFSFTTFGEGCGTLGNNPYNQIWANPRLANEWDITFTPPFSGVPSVVVSSDSDDSAFSPNSSPLVAAQGVPEGGGTNFQAIVNYVGNGFSIGGNSIGYQGGCWPYGDGFQFIAIGPK